MSILIKGMEMPTSCRACMFSRTDIRNVDWCVLTEKDLPCDCPIVPVPPHGRLIDADAFLALTNDSTILSDFLKCIINPLIRGEPTIIPADGKDTDVPTREEDE